MKRNPQPSEAARAWDEGYRKGAGDQHEDPANYTAAPRNPYLAAQPSVPAPPTAAEACERGCGEDVHPGTCRRDIEDGARWM